MSTTRPAIYGCDLGKFRIFTFDRNIIQSDFDTTRQYDLIPYIYREREKYTEIKLHQTVAKSNTILN